MAVDERSAFEQELRATVRGEVSFDQFTRGVYATDAGIHQVMPVAVFLPLDQDDVRSAVKAAAKHGVSILPRGGGTSLGGQAIGSSMVIDFTKFMNHIIELNVDERWVRVEPGVVLDELNAELAPHGLQFAPDPATSSRATIGGMMGINSAGTKSIIFGRTIDHVLEMKVLLADGTELGLGELSLDDYAERISNPATPARESEIMRGLKDLVDANRDEIEKRFPKVMRSVQGYNLDAFIKRDSWNLCHLLIGSEGGLGVTLEAKLNLVPLPKEKVICAIHFDELQQSIQSVAPILKHGPSAVELLDDRVIVMARGNHSILPLCGFIDADPHAILIVEFFGDSMDEARAKAEAMVADMKQQERGYAWPIITDPAKQAEVWAVRKNGLGLLLGIRGKRKPMAFIEDCCIPVEHLSEYIEQILSFCEERDVTAAVYAHASVGVIHVRPTLDLRERHDIDLMQDIAAFALTLVKKYGGAWSGEHGDGRVRSPFLEEFFGSELYGVLREVKQLFDPKGLMNPGMIVDPNPMDQDLRLGEDYKTPDFKTEYHYREDGGFAAAVEMCSGVGACRQRLTGAMCPSYQTLLDEEHSTRGRANALRLAMTGQLGEGGMSHQRLYEIMDLCLSCKSCKSECPSNVDLARLKSEFLQMYHDKHGVGLRDHIIARSTRVAPLLCSPLAPLVNAIQGSLPVRKLLEWVAGFDSRRTLPAYEKQTFAKWFKKRQGQAGDKKVVLFEDTYINCYDMGVGISAVELLESCGYEVILANAGCCQRPLISHGLLRAARKAGEKTLRNLDRFIQQGLTVVACEPGCASALTDDLPDLIEDAELAKRIKSGVLMIDEFIARELEAGRLDCEFTSPFEKVLIHGHCHQKALYGTTAMKQILDRVNGVEVREIDSGCCGMAGSFGYEKEHYDLSMQVGEERLFPAIRRKDEGEALVACGFSCRHQIKDGTGAKAIHWVDSVRGRNVAAN